MIVFSYLLTLLSKVRANWVFLSWCCLLRPQLPPLRGPLCGQRVPVSGRCGALPGRGALSGCALRAGALLRPLLLPGTPCQRHCGPARPLGHGLQHVGHGVAGALRGQPGRLHRSWRLVLPVGPGASPSVRVGGPGVPRHGTEAAGLPAPLRSSRESSLHLTMNHMNWMTNSRKDIPVHNNTMFCLKPRVGSEIYYYIIGVYWWCVSFSIDSFITVKQTTHIRCV